MQFGSEENCCFDFSHIFYGFVDKYHFWPKIAKFGNIPSSLASFVKKLETYSTEKSLIPKSCNTLKGTTSILQFFWSHQYLGHYGPKLVTGRVLRPSPPNFFKITHKIFILWKNIYYKKVPGHWMEQLFVLKFFW